MDQHSFPFSRQFCRRQQQTAKPRQTILIVLSALLIGLVLAACNVISSDDDEQSETALMRVLRFVPDTAEYREYLTFGDVVAWHASWGIPRIKDMGELDNLDRESRSNWIFNLPRQTGPPPALGTNYLAMDDQRGFYGFDLFNMDRYVGAGQPPDSITVVEFGFDKTQIADALTASGYTAQELENGNTLYRIRDDYEMDLQSPVRTGALGDLNRIALLERQMVIGKATSIVTRGLMAHSGEIASLAENPNFIAAARALENAALADTGELVGAVFLDGSVSARLSGLLLEGAPEEAVVQVRGYGSRPQLPFFSLAAFATRYTKGASYLILAVVFPQGTDAEEAADTLAERLRNYVSLATRGPLDEWWTFDRAAGVEAAELPVALVVMRADDRPPSPEETGLSATPVFSWLNMVNQNDLLFLMTGSLAE